MMTNYLQKAVLIVDDDTFVLKITKAMLERMGFTQIEKASNAVEALTILKKSQISVQLSLVDLNMPDIDGLELLRLFSEIDYEGDIILFSGEDCKTLQMAETLARARKLSVLGSIAKPITPDKLMSLLSKTDMMDSPNEEITQKSKITKEILEKAITDENIIPWFQPKVIIATYQPIGVEALARWPNSEFGPIFPGEFIPLAEEYGLIDALTDSLIKQTAQIGKLWSHKGINLKIALNLSMDSLYDAYFPERFNTIVTQSGGNIEQFQFEITESRLMGELAQPLEVLLRLRIKKIKLSIDDFGIGFSNLSQLHELPFDELKLDRSYVAAKPSDHRASAILETTIQLAKQLHLTTVAEGVETLEDWNKMKALGCDQVQGYLIAKPMPAEQIPEWLNNWSQQYKQLFN